MAILKTHKLNSIYPIGMTMTDSWIDLKEVAGQMADDILSQVKERKLSTIKLLCRGSSGSMLSTILVFSLMEKEHENRNIEIYYANKTKEDRHTNDAYSYCHEVNSLTVFVDDFICSGATIEAVSNFFTVSNFDFVCLFGDILRSSTINKRGIGENTIVWCHVL